MIRQPIALTPAEVRVLTRCSLHYHFRQQDPLLRAASAQAVVDDLVRETIQRLHAAGGPGRLSLDQCLTHVAAYPDAQSMLEIYYRRLEQDWSQVMASNESMSLRINIGGVSLDLSTTIDRLDKTSDGGILAILVQTDTAAPPAQADFRHDPAVTIHHALVASTYPLKRPVRIQHLWLLRDRELTVELGENEYRHNLGLLRDPVQGLARGEVMARPGSYCDVCPYKHRGCPVYARDAAVDSDSDDFVPADSGGKIPERKWIFKI
jgi:RecB family exonuclease